MERKLQTLLEKILRQIFNKKMANAVGTIPESNEANLPRKKESTVVVVLITSGPALQPQPPEYDRSQEYFARLRQKLRLLFHQEREIVRSAGEGESFEKKLRLDEIENRLEEIILLEYSNQSVPEKIARLQELQEIYRKLLKNRESGY